MNSAVTIALFTDLLPGFLIGTAIYAITIRILERRLTFMQAFFVSGVAVVLALWFYGVYMLVQATLNLNEVYDVIAMMTAWYLLGIVITRLAENYAVKKEALVGLGAKANLWLVAVSIMIFAMYLVSSHVLEG